MLIGQIKKSWRGGPGNAGRHGNPIGAIHEWLLLQVVSNDNLFEVDFLRSFNINILPFFLGKETIGPLSNLLPYISESGSFFFVTARDSRWVVKSNVEALFCTRRMEKVARLIIQAIGGGDADHRRVHGGFFCSIACPGGK
jgi:hypothetical protein